jgi:hypothetical protein
VAYGVYRGAHIKKISDSWEKSVAAAGIGDAERQEDPYNAGDKPAEGGYIVKVYFGNELLYACYGFYDRFKNKPKDWPELFDFLRFMKVDRIYKELAMNMAKAAQETQDG